MKISLSAYNYITKIIHLPPRYSDQSQKTCRCTAKKYRVPAAYQNPVYSVYIFFCAGSSRNRHLELPQGWGLKFIFQSLRAVTTFYIHAFPPFFPSLGITGELYFDEKWEAYRKVTVLVPASSKWRDAKRWYEGVLCEMVTKWKITYLYLYEINREEKLGRYLRCTLSFHESSYARSLSKGLCDSALHVNVFP